MTEPERKKWRYLTGLSAAQPALHPEALRIACEVDALLRKKAASDPPIDARASDG